MKDYEKQAKDFLKRTSTFMDINFSHNGKHFYNDNQVRDIYDVTIKRGERKFTFKFGQSVMGSQYYQDKIVSRSYSLDGKSRTGNYSINDLNKYKSITGQIKLIKGVQPTEYDILSCLTKYDPGTLEDFCSEFGYSADSKSAEKIYLSVKEEWENVQRIWTDEEIEILREIQ